MKNTITQRLRKGALLLSMAMVALFSGALSTVAFAQAEEEVSSKLIAYKVVASEEGEQLVELASVRPGDVVEYQLTYTNRSDDAITQLKPVLPVPSGMEFTAQVVSPILSAASLTESGGFQELPIKRSVRTTSGDTIEEEVDPREFKQLQWFIPTLTAGDSAVIRVRMKVLES